LRWDQDRYDQVKSQLQEGNSIIVGRGKGGSVGLAKVPGTKSLRVFISYSHQDNELKNVLLKHLEPLRRLNLIETWHDRQIKAGENWGTKIDANLDSADIILLLISIDFINSEYCYDIELDRALERHQKGAARVIPVLLRDCLWSHLPFAKFQGLPTPMKAIDTWANRDEAFVTVAEGLAQVAKELLTSR
jgi:hypothetical protein